MVICDFIPTTTLTPILTPNLKSQIIIELEIIYQYTNELDDWQK